MNTHKYLLLPISIFLLWAFDANAGVIVNRPVYLGLNQGLVGYWSFDGPDMTATTALDKSGNANNGTLTNGPVRAIGKLGQALNFDGSDDRVDISYNSALNAPNAITLAAWVNTTSSVGTIVYRYGGDPYPGYALNIAPNYINCSTAGVPSLWVGDNTNGYTCPTTAVNDGQWHHIVGTYNGVTATIYIDGVSSISATRTNSLNNTTTDMRFGTDPIAGSTRPFLGKIDDVRIYNRALSENEIRRLYQIGSTTKINATPKHQLTNGLIGYWSFDGPDMSGNTAYDRSPGNANNGTLTNGPVRAIGKLGQALDFDGSDDYVDMGDVAGTDSGQLLTVSFWLYQNTLGTSRGFVQKWANPQADTNNSWGIRSHNTDTDEFYFFVTTDNDPGNNLLGTTNADLQAKQWYHITAVYDGTQSASNRAIVYVNGATVSGTITGTIPSSLNNSSTAVTAGRFMFPGQNYCNCRIDDLRIYNRALSPNEIRRLYQIGATTKINATPKHQLTNGLVGYWSFDGPDMSGNTAYDRSPGNANNGTLTNGPVRAIGKLGQALSFDGVDDDVNIGSPATLDNLSQLSLSAWIYPRSFGGTGNAQFIVTKDNLDGWYFYTGTGSFPNDMNFVVRYTGTDLGATSPDNSLVLNRWQHVVVTWTGGTTVSSAVDFFVDGNSVGLRNPSGATTPTGSREDDATANVGIATGRNDQASNFNGQIDDVRIYNRVLSPDEVRRLYQMGR